MRQAKASRIGRPLETEVSGVLHYGTAGSFSSALAKLTDQDDVARLLTEVLTPAERRTIARGDQSGDWMFVEKGLKVGDRIVADGAHKVRRGDIVKAAQ